MSDERDFDRAVDRWLNDGSDATRPEVIDAVLLAARGMRQERDLRVPWRTSPLRRLPYAAATVAALALSVTAVSVLGLRFGIGSGPTPSTEPPVDLGIFERVAGRIVYGDRDGIWGVDPTASADRSTLVQLTSEAGTPMGWSSDGTRLLVMRQSGVGQVGFMPTWLLFVLHADGSETQVTEQPVAIRGAAISPDGSRVVYAAGIGVYVVDADADGGPVEVLSSARNGSAEDPTFSPDGTQIAYTDGTGDHSHTVWLVDADGSYAHQILSNTLTTGAGHVRGLAWSPAGGRIALGLEGSIYTFAPDGSGFTRVITDGDRPYWSPDGSQVAYEIDCPEGSTTCGFGIADADGSNKVGFGYGTAGPWHPGTLEDSAGGG